MLYKVKITGFIFTLNPVAAKDFKDSVWVNQKLKEENIAEDDNSFLASLSLQVYGTQVRYNELRELCVNYMRLQKLRLSPYYEGYFEEHCERLLSGNY